MVAAQDIRQAVHTLMQKKGDGQGMSAHEVAHQISPQHPQQIVDQVHLVLASLEQEGKLIHRNGSWYPVTAS